MQIENSWQTNSIKLFEEKPSSYNNKVNFKMCSFLILVYKD